MGMKKPERFFDTNVLLYLLSEDQAKAQRAEAELAAGGVISVQVLNEFAAVARRKAGLSYAEIREVAATVRAVCRVEDLTLNIHDIALHLAEQAGLAVYDAMIVASALSAGCRELVTEDLQHGQCFGERLVVRNPFVPG